MRVKKYVAQSMKEAMLQVRNDLGEDAVVLSTREIVSGGIFGLGKKKKIEIVAAIDVEASAAAAEAEKELPFRAATTAAVSAPQPQTALHSQTESRSQSETPSQKELRSQAQQRAYGHPPDLHEELRQMKHWIRQMAQQHGGMKSPFTEQLAARLNEQEFSAAWQDELLLSEEAIQESDIYDSIERKLMSFLRGSDISSLAKETEIAHFIGPTGVGKTTTIAKLAAEQVLKHQRSVGFITADTYRIAAVEQLRTYASILNIPMEVVHSPTDLTAAFERLQTCDLIMMDTAGRNYNQAMYVSEVNALMRNAAKSETYLVLSLTSKYSDLKKIVDNFSKFKLDRVLFTKMDETHSYGALFNLLQEYPLKPSYVTYGQNVPDDIALIDPDMIVSKVMEGLRHA